WISVAFCATEGGSVGVAPPCPAAIAGAAEVPLALSPNPPAATGGLLITVALWMLAKTMLFGGAATYTGARTNTGIGTKTGCGRMNKPIGGGGGSSTTKSGGGGGRKNTGAGGGGTKSNSGSPNANTGRSI